MNKISNLIWERGGETALAFDEEGEAVQLTAEEVRAMEFEPGDDNSLASCQDFISEAEAEELYGPCIGDEIDDDESPKRIRPATPYESSRWRGLASQSNFLKLPKRAELYQELKVKFDLVNVLRCYYSSLLELTYVVGDYSWATKLRAGRDDGNPDVLSVLQKYKIEGTNLDFIVREYGARLNNSFDEFNNWCQLLHFLPLNGDEIRGVKVFMADKNHVNWLRKQVRKDLQALNTTVPPKTIAWLCRKRYASQKKKI